MDNELPKIKRAFIETMVKEYNTPVEKAREIAEPFIQVFIDSANYGFSINHSDAYSWLGYICGYLRYYYPLEFLTACLNANKGKQEKINELLKYAKSKGIEIKQIAYGFSKADYMFDKETNSIYQGVESIKYLNASVGNGFYNFKQKYGNHDSFVDLLVDLYDVGVYHADTFQHKKHCTKCKKALKEHDTDWLERVGDGYEVYEEYFKSLNELEEQLSDCSKCKVITVDAVDNISALESFNSSNLELLLEHEKHKNINVDYDSKFSVDARQMKILITLDYFKEFGNNKALLDIFEKFDKRYSAKHKLKTKHERYVECVEFEKLTLKDNKSLSLSEQSIAEMEYLGHVVSIRDNFERNIYFVTDMKKNKQNVRFFAYQYATGNTIEFKISNKNYNNLSFEIGDIIQVQDVSIKPKTIKVGDKWIPSPIEKTFWVNQMKYIRKNRG